MNDKQLQIFLTVVDKGSFSKAEESAYISKQAMLRQIDVLEEEVGLPLLERSSSGVSPTAAGREFYRGAREMLKLRDKILSRCRGAAPEPPVLRVGQVEHQALLHPVNDAFSAKYPDIRLQKVIHPNHSGEYRVAHNIIDVGESFYTKATPRADFAYTRLADMPYLVAMAPGHPLAGRDRPALDDLAAYPTYFFPRMVKPEYLSQIRAVFAARGAEDRLLLGEDVDHQVAVAFRCSSSDALLLTANCFVTEIPELVTRPLAEGWSEEYGIIYRPHPSSIVQKYIDLAVEIYRRRL